MSRLAASLVVLFVLPAFALVALTLAPHSASAGSITHFSGTGAQAFWHFDGENGATTDVSLFAQNGRTQNPPGPGTPMSLVSVDIRQFIPGDPAVVRETFAFAFLKANQFQVGGGLNQASLSATVDAFVCESTPGPTSPGKAPAGQPTPSGEPTPTPCTPTTLTLDLTWAASGPLSSDQHSFRSHSPDCKFSERGSFTSRSAIATGTISDDAGNFTPTASQGASVFKVRDATLQIGDCSGPPPGP